MLIEFVDIVKLVEAKLVPCLTVVMPVTANVKTDPTLGEELVPMMVICAGLSLGKLLTVTVTADAPLISKL